MSIGSDIEKRNPEVSNLKVTGMMNGRVLALTGTTVAWESVNPRALAAALR